jgi:hypothetical protein
MAVPSSGTLSMVKIAREAKYGNYNGSQTMGTISLYDMVNGGNTNGSTISYPTVNDNCTPNPVSRSSHTLANVAYWIPAESTWSAFNNNYYFNNNVGDATDLEVGDILFTNTTLATTLPAGSYQQSATVANNDQYHCYVSNACGPTYFTVNSSGAITFIACDFCP